MQTLAARDKSVPSRTIWPSAESESSDGVTHENKETLKELKNLHLSEEVQRIATDDYSAHAYQFDEAYVLAQYLSPKSQQLVCKMYPENLLNALTCGVTDQSREFTYHKRPPRAENLDYLQQTTLENTSLNPCVFIPGQGCICRLVISFSKFS